MDITSELVDHISALSKLQLEEQEREMMQAQLQQIIAYVDRLQAVDTQGVEPMSHIFPVHNVFREDQVQPSSDRAALLQNAPAPDESAFLVPKTVE